MFYFLRLNISFCFKKNVKSAICLFIFDLKKIPFSVENNIEFTFLHILIILGTPCWGGLNILTASPCTKGGCPRYNTKHLMVTFQLWRVWSTSS